MVSYSYSMLTFGQNFQLIYLDLLEDLDAEGTFTFHNKVLSQLLPSSYQTLRTIRLNTNISQYQIESVYCNFEDELNYIKGFNVLEELDISIRFIFLDMLLLTTYPIAWNRLDTVLSTGFPKLRRLSISVTFPVHRVRDMAQTLRDSEDARARLENVFTDEFMWAKKNIDFKVDIKLGA